MKLDTVVIVLAVTAATFQTGYLLADSSNFVAPAHLPVADNTITTQIRSAYQLETALLASKVSVKTVHGTVRLAGLVDTDDEAARAEDIASRIEGVREVRSQIRVQGGGGHADTVASSAL